MLGIAFAVDVSIFKKPPKCEIHVLGEKSIF